MSTEFDGLTEFLRIINKLCEVAKRKGHDYGGANFLGALEISEELGVKPSIGALLRAGQKWSRVCNLVKNGEASAKVDESVDETLEDMVNYLVYVLVLRNKERQGDKRQKLELAVADLGKQEAKPYTAQRHDFESLMDRTPVKPLAPVGAVVDFGKAEPGMLRSIYDKEEVGVLCPACELNGKRGRIIQTASEVYQCRDCRSVWAAATLFGEKEAAGAH